MKKIMFVCTGNTCRSAMAEAIMRKKVQEKKKEIEVSSCGIFAQDKEPATSYSIEVMKERAIDLRKHMATNIKSSNIEKMDLILCASQSHKNIIEDLYPNLKDKVYTIKEYAGATSNLDIKDPWGNDKQEYEQCAEELEKWIEKVVEKV